MGQELKGKVAVITGASSGIGEAAARALVERGAHVVLAARRADKLERLAGQLGSAASVVPTDASLPGDIDNLFALVSDRFGGLDLLFNCAGIGVSQAFEQSDPADWRRMIDINVYGVLSCSQRAIPLMRGRPGAMIASISSVAGSYGVPEWAVYSATKFAVAGFHDALRKELANDGIRVSLIAPGATWSEFGEVPADRPGEMEARLRQLGALRPEDIASALIYAFEQPENVLIEKLVVRPILQTMP